MRKGITYQNMRFENVEISISKHNETHWNICGDLRDDGNLFVACDISTLLLKVIRRKYHERGISNLVETIIRCRKLLEKIPRDRPVDFTVKEHKCLKAYLDWLEFWCLKNGKWPYSSSVEHYPHFDLYPDRGVWAEPRRKRCA